MTLSLWLSRGISRIKPGSRTIEPPFPVAYWSYSNHLPLPLTQSLNWGKLVGDGGNQFFNSHEVKYGKLHP